MNTALPIESPRNVATDYRVYLVSDAAHLDELEREWGALFDIAPTASPPLRWEWVREWWRIFGPVYGDRGRGLRLITVRRGPDLIGVLPIYQRTTSGPWGARQLRFISSGEAEFEETCAEYLDLLHAPQESRACIEVISRFLNSLGWDEFCLSDMSDQSPLLGFRGRPENWIRRVRVTTVSPCYVFDISGGFEAYLGRLSHKNRQQARKLLRAVDQAGLTFDLATNGELITTYFDQMVTLHKERWTAVGKTSSFAPRHAEFHRSMAHLLAPTGAVVLARLALGKTPFAVVYGHRVGEKMYCYQQGVAPESDVLRSPGTVAWLLLMRTMAEQGVTLFDQQSGTSGFKERFATGEHPLAEMRVARPTLRHMATATVDLARRGTAKLVRRLKKLSLSGQPLLGKDPVSLPREPVKKV